MPPKVSKLHNLAYVIDAWKEQHYVYVYFELHKYILFLPNLWSEPFFFFFWGLKQSGFSPLFVRPFRMDPRPNK